MKVIMCSYGVGYKSTLPPKNVIKLNLNTYRTEYRERTEEELQIEKENGIVLRIFYLEKDMSIEFDMKRLHF